MNPNCLHKNPLKRDGTSQVQRILEALGPDYVKIDEREFADLLTFAREYSEKVNYWDKGGNDTQLDWLPFFKSEVVIAARLQHEDTGGYERIYRDIERVVSDDAAFNLSNYQELYLNSEAGLHTIFRRIDSYLNEADALDGDLSTRLREVVERSGPEMIRLLSSYDTGAVGQLSGVVLSVSGDDYTTMNSAFEWSPFTVIPDSSIYTGASNIARAKASMPYLNSIHEALLNLLGSLQKVAAKYTGYLLESYPEHEPYMSLFLAFLQLFRHAQDHINGLPARHLDFFYREVLQLVAKDAIPAQVHLVFELAKGVDAYLVEAGTRFKAGKDDTGQAVVFELDRDLVINRARVADIRTLYYGDYDDPVSSTTKRRFFAAPVANSFNGLGADLDPLAPWWPPFGEARKHLDLDGDGTDDVVTMQMPRYGFAISSPVFWVREGQRELDIELELVSGTFTAASLLSTVNGALTARITSTEEWLGTSPGSDFTISATLSSNTLTIKLTLTKDAPEVTFYDQEVHGGSYRTKWPVVEFFLSGTSALVDLYEPLRKVKVDRMTLRADVKGVTELIVLNDDGKVDPSKPFAPFTRTPLPGANFYIGSAEIFSKKLKQLDINVQWMGIPSTNLSAYYRTYKRTNGTYYHNNLQKDGNFNARLKILDGHIWKHLVQEPVTIAYVDHFAETPYESAGGAQTGISQGVTQLSESQDFLLEYHLSNTSYSPLTYWHNRIKLFDNSNAQLPRKFTVSEAYSTSAPFPYAHFNQPLNNDVTSATGYVNTDRYLLNYSRDPQLKTLGTYRPALKRGYVKFELDSTLYHEIYAKVLTETILFNQDPANTDLPYPNEPMVPLIRELSLDYQTEEVVDYASLTSLSDAAYSSYYQNRIEQFFHIQPFGEMEILPTGRPLGNGTVVDRYLFPQFRTPELDSSGTEFVKATGALYIGLDALQAPGLVSLLFQMAEGTEDPVSVKPKVHWTFLNGDRWIGFSDSQIIFDTTNNLVNSGITQFEVPVSATTEHTLMPAGKHWIRGIIGEIADGDQSAFSRMISIQAQAMSATFADQGNDSQLLADPFHSDSVTGFESRVSSVKKVLQPFVSFGGKVAEEGEEYYRRISERLRHKQRAINIFDYERIVLEEFPEIFKVKCINHTDDNSELAPGSVSVVLIPRVEKLNGVVNPYELKVGARTLYEVDSLLRKLITPFVNLEVKNPRYEKVGMDFGVKFLPGYDPAYYRNQLHTDLKRYISPWAFGNLDAIKFGGELQSSLVVNYMEELEYVDYIVDFRMYHLMEKEFVEYTTATLPTPDILIEASTAASVLVTADQHSIEVK